MQNWLLSPVILNMGNNDKLSFLSPHICLIWTFFGWHHAALSQIFYYSRVDACILHPVMLFNADTTFSHSSCSLCVSCWQEIKWKWHLCGLDDIYVARGGHLLKEKWLITGHAWWTQRIYSLLRFFLCSHPLPVKQLGLSPLSLSLFPTY